ncbi:nucleobase:cation symporter-2 family protein [Castellaniella sp.]|uniref:nucleobase:cation symporter-2 family protein n=1 Tax=Castellaniella sp. TaxID=1955812 RepID=UPI002AFFDD63|nr:nucleobase:cation symporter-2 family protein [Castellaniella sp.]
MNLKKSDVHPADEVLPVWELFIFGLQHVLIMYAGAIAVPLIIGGVLGLPKEQIALLINCDLFACGVISILQSVGFWKFGVRLPVMMGVTFATVPSMIILAGDPNIGAQGLYGSIIGAGIVTMILAPFVGKLVRFFPPVVTGTVIAVTGLTILRIGINWAAGGNPTIRKMVDGVLQDVPNPNYGAPENLLFAGLVLIVILLLAKFAKGFWANISVLVGLLVGFALAWMTGRVDLTGLREAAWFEVIEPLAFGWPTFHPWAILSLSIVMVIVMVETIGLLLAVGEMVGRRPGPEGITRGLLVDGLGTVIGGIFNTFPYVSFSQNIGLVGVTGIKSRWVCAMAGIILIVFALFPKLGILAASIPAYVLGGAGIVMFGMVCATGIKILSDVDYRNQHNLFIVAISVGIGLIPMIAPSFFGHFPKSLTPLTHSGIALSAIVSMLLNFYFNHFRASRTQQAASAEV